MTFKPISCLLGNDVLLVTTQLESYIRIFTTAILAVCGLLVILYAVYVGYKFAKATDDAQRQQAKQQLVYSIVGAVSIIALGALFGLAVVDSSRRKYSPEPDALGQILNTAYISIAAVVDSILRMLAVVAVVFACWVGWQLMKAEDESKRNQAKKQLIYTFMGVVVVVLLNTVISEVFLSLGGAGGGMLTNLGGGGSGAGNNGGNSGGVEVSPCAMGGECTFGPRTEYPWGWRATCTKCATSKVVEMKTSFSYALLDYYQYNKNI